MAGRRYWRINITANNGGANTYIGEIELRAAGSGVDYTGSGTATASTFYSSGFEASKAFDNTAATRWGTQVSVPTGWIKYDFGGSPVYITEYTLQSSASGSEQTYMAKDWTLEYSDDDVNWTVVHTVTNSTGWTTSLIRTWSFKPDWINKKNANRFNSFMPTKVNGNSFIHKQNL